MTRRVAERPTQQPYAEIESRGWLHHVHVWDPRATSRQLVNSWLILGGRARAEAKADRELRAYLASTRDRTPRYYL